MNVLVRAALVAAMGLGLAASANAATITFTFSGNAGGETCVLCTGAQPTPWSSDPTTIPFGDFTFVVTADTASITGGADFKFLSNVSGTFTRGSYAATLTGVTVESSPTFSNIDFYASDFLNGLGMSHPALGGYTLSSSIGPLNDTDSGASLTPTFGFGSPLSFGAGFATLSGERVFLTSNRDLTFQATLADATVPEPGTITLVGLGLVALRRRRRTIA